MGWAACGVRLVSTEPLRYPLGLLRRSSSHLRAPLASCEVLLSQRWLVYIEERGLPLTTKSFCMITAYAPTFAKTEIKLSEIDSFLINMLVGLSNSFWLPTTGRCRILWDENHRAPLR